LELILYLHSAFHSVTVVRRLTIKWVRYELAPGEHPFRVSNLLPASQTHVSVFPQYFHSEMIPPISKEPCQARSHSRERRLIDLPARLSVGTSVRVYQRGSTGRNSVKFCIGDYHDNLSRSCKCGGNQTKY